MTAAARTGRLVGIAVWSSVLQQWTWRSLIVTLVVEQAVTPLLGLLVWSAALPGNDAVPTYYAILLVVQLSTVSYEHHTLSNGIYDGHLGADLLEPRPVVLGFVGQNLAMRIWHLVFGIPVIVGVAAAVGVSVDPYAVTAAVPAVLVAAALRFVFTYTLALSALWTQRAHGMVGFGETLVFLLGGTAAPLGLLPEPFRVIGHAMPFWSMLGMPAEVAAGTLHGAALARAYGMQVGWLVASVAVAALVWRLGLRRFTALGG